MSERTELIIRVLILGVGATMTMDLWALFLKQFGVNSLNFAFLGRWIGHLPEGRWFHEAIAKSTPVKGELVVGWLAHYSIGISFAGLLVGIYGSDWLKNPSLLPALIIGIITVLAPWFILQPALGAGIASSKTATPLFNAIKSLVTHFIYGLGLYLNAVVTAAVIFKK